MDSEEGLFQGVSSECVLQQELSYNLLISTFFLNMNVRIITVNMHLDQFSQKSKLVSLNIKSGDN